MKVWPHNQKRVDLHDGAAWLVDLSFGFKSRWTFGPDRSYFLGGFPIRGVA